MAILMFSGKAAAGIVRVGSPADTGTGNCIPFGCGYNGEYQQIYTAGAFSGPITINALQFYNTQNDGGATAINSGNWEISLSTTPADWNTLSATPGANVGSDNSVVFDGNLSQSWTFGDTLTISLSSPFTYDPSNGNLLMDVLSSGLPAIGSTGSSSIYFDTNGFDSGNYDGNSIMGRVSYKTADSGYGLVTGFDSVSAPVTSVPAPPTFLLIGPGLIALAAPRRSKKGVGDKWSGPRQRYCALPRPVGTRLRRGYQRPRNPGIMASVPRLPAPTWRTGPADR